MPSNVIQSNQTGLVKTIWPQKSIYEIVFRGVPFLGLIPKDENCNEWNWRLAAGYSLAQGLSSTYATARTNRNASKSVEFQLSPYPYYGVELIDGRTMRRANSDKAYVLNIVKRSAQNLLTQANRDFCYFIHGNGGGALGQIGATATTTITLLNPKDINAFSVGMTIDLSTADGTSGAIRTVVSPAEITQVGTEENPVLTFGANVSTYFGSAPAVNDYIFRSGTFGAVMPGLAGWCPAHAGTPGTFLTVNRNIAPQQLAGVSLSVATLTVRAAILRIARRVFDQGGTPDLVLLSTTQWENLHNELLTAGSLRMAKVPAAKVGSVSVGIEYDAIEMVGPGGTMRVVPDVFMPATIVRVLTTETWKLRTQGPLFQWIENASLTSGGLKMENATDDYEMRLISDGALQCEAPGFNGVGYGLT